MLFRVNFKIELKTENVINLESFYPDKFSSHLIIKINGIAFENNRHLGNFVNQIFEHINQSKNQNPSLESLWASNDKEEKKFIVDLSVYSRNRSFRCYKSTKMGKNSHFILSTHNKFTNFKDDCNIFFFFSFFF